jgi:hypothetical protein
MKGIAPIGLSLLLAVPALAAAAGAVEHPNDFAYSARIELEASGALYRLALSQDVYRGVADPGLADLRVFNGAGEVVPHALYPRRGVQSAAVAPVPLKVFSIPTPPAHGAGAAEQAIHIQTDGKGAVVRVDLGRVLAPSELASSGPSSYLLDASALSEPIRAVVLELRASADYSGRARLEASDDLAAWRPIAADTPILGLTQGGERLERRRIEFAPCKAKYYRLAWTGMPPGVQLGGVLAQPGELRSEPEHQWQAVSGGDSGDGPGVYFFDSRAHFPTDRLRFELPQPNTIAGLQVFSRDRTQDPWQAVARETAYRLTVKDGEVASPTLVIRPDSDRYWLLRVDQRGGGLGSGTPRLMLGWIPHELAFAARGAAPFLLAFGQRNAKPTAIGIEALVPGYRDDASAISASAPAGANPMATTRATLAALTTVAISPVEPDLAERLNAGRLALWSLLVGGVALLAWMAWRLLQQMNAAQNRTDP